MHLNVDRARAPATIPDTAQPGGVCVCEIESKMGTRKKNNPTSIGELIDSVLDKGLQAKKNRGQAIALKVFAAFERLGGTLRAHAEPVFFRGGRLTLEVTSSGWMTELSFLKPQLMHRLNRSLKKPYVTDIRLRLGQNKKPQEPPRPQKPLSRTQQEHIESWANCVVDPDVREALRSAATKSLSAPNDSPPPPPGPPGPQITPTSSEGVHPRKGWQPRVGLTYGYGNRHSDRFKKKNYT